MRDYRRLAVWTKAYALTLKTYSQTAGFPRDEVYGLTSQVRRSVASIPANITEGCGRDSDRELARFLLISMGSANEAEVHLLLARDLEYLTPEAYGALAADLAEIKRMMSGLLARLPARSSKLAANSSELEA
jgi:four helix bundle protein